MLRLSALALILFGCTKQQPAPDVRTRGPSAPDLASIPEGSGWSCDVRYADGGTQDDICKRTAESCEALLVELSRLDDRLREMNAQLGIPHPHPDAMRCVPSATAHCFTYLDTRDSLTHWECVRTSERCELRRGWFRGENQREPTVRYRSISDCELVR